MAEPDAQASLKERRSLYFCRDQYVPLEQIPTWCQWAEENNLSDLPASAMEVEPTLAADGTVVDLSSKIRVYVGDITRLEVDGIVNAANAGLRGGGGVDGAIHRNAGHADLQKACRAIGGCDPGDAVVTPGFRLPARFIVHTVGPTDQDPRTLTSCYDRCLARAKEHGMRSIAFNCIATGIYGFPDQAAAAIAAGRTHAWLQDPANRDSLDAVVFCLFTRESVLAYKTQICKYFPIASTATTCAPAASDVDDHVSTTQA